VRFLFKRYAYHRNLHSFPTRRSSDLCCPARRRSPWSRGSSPIDTGRPTTSRSEEHTSELQSHLNLVCRLLLEQKQINSAHARAEAIREQKGEQKIPPDTRQDY